MGTFPHVSFYKKAYKSYRISFFVSREREQKCTRFLVRVDLVVGRYKIWFVQYKNHYAYRISTSHKNVCVCENYTVFIHLIFPPNVLLIV